MTTVDPRLLLANLETVCGVEMIAPDNLVPLMDDSIGYIRSTLPMWDAWQTSKPPCTTCGGSGALIVCSCCGCIANGDRCDNCGGPTDGGYCPACVDHSGVQPFAEWVIAVWTAVHDTLGLTKLRHEAGTKTDADVIMALRRIGGIR